jgi:HD superfamily phosphohydrolase
MTDILSIDELNQFRSDRGIVRIPMEQDVPFTPRIKAIVDTPEFRRLAHISQLGLVSLVYPGATHTRFEHSLGVMSNAIKYLMQLSKDERFRDIVTAQQAELLLVSALLHDIGHWPFCHPIEDMHLTHLPSHEAFASQFLLQDTQLGCVLKSEWNIDPADVVRILAGEPLNSVEELLQSILSGPIDVDKMDYLDRDSLHCGVPYGRNFDRQRLIQSLILNEAGDGLALMTKGKTAAELMVFARYVMFSEVYWHHAVRAATCMFGRAFYHVHEKLDVNQFVLSDENGCIQQLRTLTAGTPAERLTDGIFSFNRSLYKRLFEASHDTNPEIYAWISHRPFAKLVELSEQLAIELSKHSGTTIEPTDLLIDAPPPHREVEFNITLKNTKSGEYRRLQEMSPVVEALAVKQFDDYVKKVRIFLHPRFSERQSLQGIIVGILKEMSHG